MPGRNEPQRRPDGQVGRPILPRASKGRAERSRVNLAGRGHGNVHEGEGKGAARPEAAQIWAIGGGFLAGLGLLVVAALAYARWRQGGMNWELVVRQIRSLEPGWLSAAAALAVGSYVVRAVRWGVMLAAVKQGARLANLLSATAIGFTAVLLLGRAGELVRPYMIARKEGVPIASQLGAWLLERLYDLIATLLLFGYALGHWRGAGQGWLEQGLRSGGWVLFAAACGGGAAVAAMGLRPAWAEGRLMDALAVAPGWWREKVGPVFRGFLAGLASVRSFRDQCMLCLYTLLEWLVIAGACWCFFRASSWTSGFGARDVLIFVGAVSIGSLLQVPGIGGGMQLTATVVLAELYRIPVEASIGLAVVLWIITVVVVLPFGLMFGLREGVNWITIKRASEQVRA